MQRCDARVLSLVDLFHAHIGSMDAFAKGLRVAAAIEADNALSDPLSCSLFQLGWGTRQKN